MNVMNVWILIDGEKSGPWADYEVRRRIAEGVYGRDTMGWHEGCREWTPLGKMTLFEREFTGDEEQRVVAGEGEGGRESEVERRKDMEGAGWSGGVYWLRRFWARWLDLHLYAGVWWLGLYFSGVNVGAVLGNVWMMLLLYLPWVPVEAWLISRFQTTPGKWFAGVRIMGKDGANLDFAVSLRRAVRVYFLGIGMGWGVVSLICQGLACFTVRRTGLALWDRDGTHVVLGVPWKVSRSFVVMAAYVLVTQMQWMVIAPYFLEDLAKRHPEWHEWMHKNPPKHLPRKHGGATGEY